MVDVIHNLKQMNNDKRMAKNREFVSSSLTRLYI